MRALTLAFGILLLSITPCAQAQHDSVRIKIRHLTLVGPIEISPAEQQQIAAEIENLNPLTRGSGSSVTEISERLRYALQERGFFKALPMDLDVAIVSSSPSEEVIDATYYVNLGQRYRLKQITFSNVDPKKGFAFATSELRQSFPIDDGGIFDTAKIRIGLENLRQLYANSGYINCTPVPNTEADDASGTIALRVDLDEGAIFRLGSLALEGVEPVRGVGAKLLEAWKPYEGQVYSQTLLESYMRENAAYLAPNASLGLFRISQDPQDHVVNFVLELDDAVATN